MYCDKFVTDVQQLRLAEFSNRGRVGEIWEFSFLNTKKPPKQKVRAKPSSRYDLMSVSIKPFEDHRGVAMYTKSFEIESEKSQAAANICT